MKLKQLRSIIHSIIKEAIVEAAAPDPTMDDAIQELASAFAQQVNERLNNDVVVSNIVAQALSVIPDDSLMRPGRYEDVDHFATKLVDEALKFCRDDLHAVASSVLRNLMEPKT